MKNLELENEAKERTVKRAWGRKGAPKEVATVAMELEEAKLRNLEMMEKMRALNGRMKVIHKLAGRLKNSSVRYLFRRVTDGRDGDLPLPLGR